MALINRLQLAAELAEGAEPAILPDAATVGAKCRSWGVDAELKLHQAEGVAWLIHRYARGVNVILGDEMGLGKTLQAIVLLSYLVSERHCSGPFLILSPLSVSDGWASELARFAPKLKLLRYVGDKEERQGLRKMICNRVNEQLPEARLDPALPFQILLTTYELAVLDAKFLSLVRWRYTIVDEAQRLKNPSTVLYRTLQEQYMAPRRLLLTGTPVQNNLSELWSLLHFCMPLIFNDLNSFLTAFGSAAQAIQDATAVNSDVNSDSAGEYGAKSPKERLQLLRHILRAFMLRRTKADLVKAKALSLPPVVEVTIFAPLVPIQKKVYLSVLKKESPNITGARNGSASKKSLQNIVIQLRKACSHPYLFDGVEPEPFEEGEHLVQASGKLIILDMVLRRLRREGHRVLLFAQMTRTLDLIQDYLQLRGYTYERLDGSVRAEERFAAVRNFSATGMDAASAGTFMFLLTTRAGGVGLNLVAADTVIFYEQDWNPQVDNQAMQRAHRIGQLRSVLVMNLVTENTIEEVIMRRARTKLQLTQEVIGRDVSELDEHGESGTEATDLQSMIVFGLHKIVTQAVPSGEEKNDTLLDNTDLAAKLITIIERALDQRAKIGMTDVGKEQSISDNPTLQKRLSLGPAKEEPEYLNQLLMDEDEDVDFVALRSLKADLENGSTETSVENVGRRGRKQAFPVSVNDSESLARKKQRKIENMQSKWSSLGYQSLAVSDPDAKFQNDAHVGEENTDYIHHLVGDCTKPSLDRRNRGIILWCLDDSGTWGNGGLFNALARLSKKIPEAYEAAHEAGDLHLGDLHLVPVRETTTDPNPEKDENGTHLWVALAVVQRYDRRKKAPRSEISFPDLELCIMKLAGSAAVHSGSVHMPRISAGDHDGKRGWYVVERLLRKYAAMYRVHFNIYYFNRNANSS